MEQLFNRVCSQDVAEDDFSPDAEQSKPCFSQAGDLWHLGKHTVLCGDSPQCGEMSRRDKGDGTVSDATKPESYQILLPNTKVNLVLTDPPYNVNVEETAGRIQNDNMPDAEFYQFLLSAFQQMHEVLAEDGSIYVFHSDTKGAVLSAGI
ncbi:MAG: DNA methyltransferase [Ruminococcus sp.]